MTCVCVYACLCLNMSVHLRVYFSAFVYTCMCSMFFERLWKKMWMGEKELIILTEWLVWLKKIRWTVSYGRMWSAWGTGSGWLLLSRAAFTGIPRTGSLGSVLIVNLNNGTCHHGDHASPCSSVLKWSTSSFFSLFRFHQYTETLHDLGFVTGDCGNFLFLCVWQKTLILFFWGLGWSPLWPSDLTCVQGQVGGVCDKSSWCGWSLTFWNQGGVVLHSSPDSLPHQVF